MSVKFSLEVKGLDDVIGTLNRFDLAGRARVVEAVQTTSTKLRAGARSRLRRLGSGRLARSVRTKFSKDRMTGSTALYAKGGRVHPLSHIVEFGTAPHAIKPKAKRALAFGGGPDAEGFAAAVQHPGAPANPFLFPAFEEVRGEFEKALAGALTQAAKDAASGSVPAIAGMDEDDS